MGLGVKLCITFLTSLALAAPDGNIMWGTQIGPLDKASIGGGNVTPRRHPVTMAKLGLSPDLRHQMCTPALFQVKEIAHPTKNAKYRPGVMNAGMVLQYILTQLPHIQYAAMPLSPFHNVDGRIGAPVLGTMGSDVGEFLLALNALERYTRLPLTRDQVALLLFDYLVTTDIPQFNLPMESTVLQNLCSDTTVSCCLPGCSIDNPYFFLVQNGSYPRNVKGQLTSGDEGKMLAFLTAAENQGSGYFRHLLSDPDALSTRKELTTAVLEAFFRLLWGLPLHNTSPLTLSRVRAKLRLQIVSLPFSASPLVSALVHVRTGLCHPGMIPMLIPSVGGASVLFLHDDAAQHRRAFNADWLVENAEKMDINHPSAHDPHHLLQVMNQLAAKQYAASLARDNGNTPLFALEFPAACCGGLV